MEDHLSAAPLHVKNNSVARIRNPFLLRRLPGHPKHLGKKIFVLGCEVIKASDMLPGNNEKMNGSVRLNIFENDCRLVLKHDVRRPLPPHNLTEYAFLFHPELIMRHDFESVTLKRWKLLEFNTAKGTSLFGRIGTTEYPCNALSI